MDRRNAKRRHLILFLRIFDDVTGELLGYLGDIHAGGMLIISDNPMSKGEKLKLRMQLPVGGSRTGSLHFTGDIRWCDRDVNVDFYDIGIQFDDVSDEYMEALGDLVTEFGFTE